tara:strand:+ start:691 stop:876 length:186 start_codon:yes stop_codon:yes gene_type:complete
VEKPYLYLNETSGMYFLVTSETEFNKNGATNFNSRPSDGTGMIDFQDVFVADATVSASGND